MHSYTLAHPDQKILSGPNFPMTTSDSPEPFVSIAAVERDTGLSKDTLRVWERRYGFPQPGRDANGERSYPRGQLEKLRLIKRLIDNGHRPGKLMSLDGPSLQGLSEPRDLRRRSTERRAFSAEKRVSLKAYLALVQDHAQDKLRLQLMQSQRQWGLARFVTERVAPLNQMVADAVMRGQMAAFAERAYAECAKRVVLDALHGMPAASPSASPRVMLTTFAQETSGLGIVMAEAMFALEGCQTLSLGLQTPVYDMVQAIHTYRMDLLALSFGDSLNPNDISSGLEQLRQSLPGPIEIWVIGPCKALSRRAIAGVHQVPGLEGIAPTLTRWRMQYRF